MSNNIQKIDNSVNITKELTTQLGTDNTSTGTLNDVSAANTSFFRFTNNTGPTITGLANGANGKRLTLAYTGSGTMQVNNNDSGSSAANRIITGTGANVTIAAGASAELIYDSVASLWRIVGSTGSSSGMTNPMTTTGDIIYSSNNSGTPARLGIGFEGATLQVSSGGLPTWVGGTAPSNTRGLFSGGNVAAGRTNTITYIDTVTTGNATDFGDLTLARELLGSCSSVTRSVFAGGINDTPNYYDTLTIDYVTLATTGNATSFGNLSIGRSILAGLGNSTRGIFAGGYIGGGGGGIRNTIDYITIASTGDATDFGDLGTAIAYLVGTANTTRGITAGGGASTAVIEYITIATTGNATSFGNLSVGRYAAGAAANATIGLFAGGFDTAETNVIDYITIATTGNATDFGDLTITRSFLAGTANTTRAVFGGGFTGASLVNTIDYVTIASVGNATDFGDLTAQTNTLAACSGAHGGI